MVAFATPVFLNSHTNSVFLHSRKRPASITDNVFAFRTTVLYLQSPLGSFWSLLTNTVWHFVASQKYSINVHLPTSGRAVVPSAYRMAKRKPRGIIAIERANDIHSTKQQIDKWINHSMNVQIECNLAFLSWLSQYLACWRFTWQHSFCTVSVYHNNKRSALQKWETRKEERETRNYQGQRESEIIEQNRECLRGWALYPCMYSLFLI